MLFRELTEYFEKLELTTKRLEMTEILVTLFKKLAQDPDELKKAVYLLLGELYPPYVGIELGVSEKLIARAIARASGHSLGNIEEELEKTGDIGRVAEKFMSQKKQLSFFKRDLTVKDVYNELDRVAKEKGEGAIKDKIARLSGLFADCSPKEARYLARIADGTLRLGVAEMTVLDALAIAFGRKEDRSVIEYAYNLISDIGRIAEIVASEGIEGIKKVRIQVGIPVRPMLAERLEDPKEILRKMNGRVALEYKYDGERMQIHKKGNKVEIFSRRLERITDQFPDVVNLTRTHIEANECIVEGEAVAINPDTGEMRPFQELMHRKRKYEIEKAAEEYPVALKLFDLLYLDGETYLDRPYPERREKLEKIVKVDDWVELSRMKIVDNVDDMWKFFYEAIQDGCEGLVCKSVDASSTYQAGARGWLWIKFKRDYRSELTDTLDLVLVGAFYGRGRKAGVPSSFLMAAYNKEKDVFQTVCKVGTGFKDEELLALKDRLEELKVDKKPARVESVMEPDFWVYPKLVLEITAAEITISPVHTAGIDKLGYGLALRFPRFTGRLREDKAPEDATTVDEVIEMFKSQRKIKVE